MSHLTEVQRYKIQALLEQKSTIKTIAEYLGKDKSVISREIKRNRDQRSKRYDAELAQRKYKKRLHEKPKHIRLTSSMKGILCSDPLKPIECRVEHVPGSDHWPVIATLTVSR